MVRRQRSARPVAITQFDTLVSPMTAMNDDDDSEGDDDEVEEVIKAMIQLVTVT